MKKKDFNSKLKLNKSTISNLNVTAMKNVIGASATITNGDTTVTTAITQKTTNATTTNECTPAHTEGCPVSDTCGTTMGCTVTE